MLLSHSAAQSSEVLASCNHSARTSHLGRPAPQRLRQSSRTRPCAVTVHFKEKDIIIEAEPAENLVQLAQRAGVVIETGCNSGSCGVCEVEVRKYGGPNAEADGATPAVVRACIAAVPPGYSSIEIAYLSDHIWGSDGWDT